MSSTQLMLNGANPEDSTRQSELTFFPHLAVVGGLTVCSQYTPLPKTRNAKMRPLTRVGCNERGQLLFHLHLSPVRIEPISLSRRQTGRASEVRTLPACLLVCLLYQVRTYFQNK